MAPEKDPNDSLPLPAEKMPECWNQDERMNALFAQLRNRSVNQQDWNSKYTFWRGMILAWLKDQMRCTFSISELNAAFKRKGRTPLCLPFVVQEFHKNHEIITLTDFMKEPASTWGAWAIDVFVKKPVVWSFLKMKNSLIEQEIDVNVKYVHLQTVRELGEIISSTIGSEKENILVPLSEVTKSCAKKTNNKFVVNENVMLALIWLKHVKKAAFKTNSFKQNDELLVKISSRGVLEVSEVEESLYNLTKQEQLLTTNLELLELEKNAVMKNAKSYLAGGLRQLAKTCLRKKRELDKTIEKRANSLQNVQTLIVRIRDVHSDSEILTSYKTGCTALKKKLEESGLTEDNVRETMNELSEVLEEFNELQTVMSTSVDVLDSDSELENELAELMTSSPTTSNSAATEARNLEDARNKQELDDLEKELAVLNLRDLPSPSKSLSTAKTAESQPPGRKKELVSDYN